GTSATGSEPPCERGGPRIPEQATLSQPELGAHEAQHPVQEDGADRPSARVDAGMAGHLRPQVRGGVVDPAREGDLALRVTPCGRGGDPVYLGCERLEGQGAGLQTDRLPDPDPSDILLGQG